MSTDIDQQIRKRLIYENGHLYWTKCEENLRCSGKKAGHKSKIGYIQVRINYRLVSAHRIVFFLHKGYWPKEIDHINRIKDDNRIENLRECSRAQNNCNRNAKNESIYGKNVYYDEAKNLFRVRLQIKSRWKNLGYYKDLELAQLVSSEAREKYYGEFA